MSDKNLDFDSRLAVCGVGSDAGRSGYVAMICPAVIITNTANRAPVCR